MKLRTTRSFITLIALLVAWIATTNAQTTYNVQGWTPYGSLTLQNLTTKSWSSNQQIEITNSAIQVKDWSNAKTEITNTWLLIQKWSQPRIDIRGHKIKVTSNPDVGTTWHWEIRVEKICDEYWGNCKMVSTLWQGWWWGSYWQLNTTTSTLETSGGNHKVSLYNGLDVDNGINVTWDSAIAWALVITEAPQRAAGTSCNCTTSIHPWCTNGWSLSNNGNGRLCNCTDNTTVECSGYPASQTLNAGYGEPWCENQPTWNWVAMILYSDGVSDNIASSLYENIIEAQNAYNRWGKCIFYCKTGYHRNWNTCEGPKLSVTKWETVLNKWLEVHGWLAIHKNWWSSIMALQGTWDHSVVYNPRWLRLYNERLYIKTGQLVLENSDLTVNGNSLDLNNSQLYLDNTDINWNWDITLNWAIKLTGYISTTNSIYTSWNLVVDGNNWITVKKMVVADWATINSATKVNKFLVGVTGNMDTNCYSQNCMAAEIDDVSEVRFIPKSLIEWFQISDFEPCGRRNEGKLVYYRDRDNSSNNSHNYNSRLEICMCAHKQTSTNSWPDDDRKCEWKKLAEKNY